MFLVSFLALTQSILNFLKTLFRFEFSIKIPKNDVKHKNSHGEFSDIKSSNRNPMDDFEIISYCNIFLSKNAAIFGGLLALFQYWSLLLHKAYFQGFTLFLKLPFIYHYYHYHLSMGFFALYMLGGEGNNIITTFRNFLLFRSTQNIYHIFYLQSYN